MARTLDRTFQTEAKGHNAVITKFDTDTALVPLSKIELFRLMSLVLHSNTILEASKDFPEKQEYENLYSNLCSAHFLLSK